MSAEKREDLSQMIASMRNSIRQKKIAGEKNAEKLSASPPEMPTASHVPTEVSSGGSLSPAKGEAGGNGGGKNNKICKEKSFMKTLYHLALMVVAIALLV
ncbi:MAG: hypothetical protein KJ717_10810, partial [Proteobacteria bacterium]|nr:hypothetical protein [Pseudomonadota bacterium]